MDDADATLDTSSSDANQNEQSEQQTQDQQPGKRSAEARIHELLAKNKEMEAKLTDIEARMAPTPAPATSTDQPAPEVQRAVDYLKKLGFVQKEDQEKAIKTIEDRLVLNNEHLRLETKFKGEDGLPAYSRKEVEDFMRQRGVYDPEIAYKEMYQTEVFDHKLKQYEADRKKKPFVEKPSATTGVREGQTITREKIADWLKTPDGRNKYEQNRDKIMSMLQKGEL